jgi:hypothetical protein
MDMDAAQKRTTVCPLCIEELDDTDRHFIPCKCGYQVRSSQHVPARINLAVL